MRLYLFSYMVPEAPQALHLFNALMGSSNVAGGWGYAVRKASRLEPTCWALLAAGQSRGKADLAIHGSFLEKCTRSGGCLVEDPRWPINVGFNALVAFTWLNRREFAAEEKIRALLSWLSTAKGVQAPQTTSYRQDNSLQGWSGSMRRSAGLNRRPGNARRSKGIRAGLVQEALAHAAHP
jgi:hypothetical protein